jgi:hypothetical protein
MFLSTTLLLAQESDTADFSPDYSDVSTFLFDLKTVGERIEVQQEILIQRDVGLFRLSEGYIYPCKKYKNEVVALIFLGKGDFSFTPPSKVEKEQLSRFYETEKYETEFKKLFLLFDDNTMDEVAGLRNTDNFNPKKIDYEIEGCLTYFEEYDIGNTRSDFLRALLLAEKTGFFYAHIQDQKYEPVFFQINPFEFEEVSFMKRYDWGSEVMHEIVNQFPAQEKSLGNYFYKKPKKYFLDIISYRIESTIEDNLDFSAKCTIDFTSKEQGQEWIMFELFHELEVSSVNWGDGNKAKFVNAEETGELWIKCEKKYLNGEQQSLTVTYEGELLEKNEYGWISLKTTYLWYPWLYDYKQVQFELTFHTPAQYDFVSIGDLVQSNVINDVLTTTWICKTPSRFASFNIGRFEIFEIKEKDLPVVKVFISEYGHSQMGEWLRRRGVLAMSDATEFIGHDVVNSLNLFTELFGAPPINTLCISETPILHGVAFPGLIHLSWSTVIQTNFEGYDEIFRSHEVAHQWWGIGVDFKTYHDQWLSEGFAEYSALWYLQAAKGNNELFFEILNEYKDRILNVREYLIGSGQEAGPIWLGYRTSSGATAGDYNLIIYKKGAWVLHMLRAMLLDLQTMNEERMLKMMHDYFNKYKGKSASTDDFKKLVDQHFGEDMSWFFDQYVYGTEIPLYKFYYTTQKSDDGSFKVRLYVKQEEVSDSFKMYVPIKIILENGTIGRLRFLIEGPETIYELPPLPSVPEDIIFNDLESVLCEVEYTEWD